MNANQDNLRRIFSEAADLRGDEQAAFLKEACGADEQLRASVERLLKHDAEVGSFMNAPVIALPVAPTLDVAPIAERPGTQIGPYKLHQEIGEGGMGIVYMALQKEPVRRKVALKIIKPGMDTREVIARFAAEKQALAIMDHPNIAKVHDAGTTESGRPYFVMELVNGVTLTQYCDDNKLTTDQRLELFVPICRAVQHAHQKGIIHRDIKPSNILVTLHDGVPVPKIIDFGIAKATNQELTTQTLATGYGQMVGTPLYMSPEQAERSGLDIDTRSDIYSLGVLLYELLTGSTPFSREQFKEAGLDEVRRLIREEEPPRPSTRISAMGKAATTVSEHRRTDPVELSNSLRHEVDWIVMKALEKDRTRRYQTANDFARDVERYLHDEAVEACPPSTAYRLHKFTRRHQTAAIATAAVSLALILGAGIAAGQAYRATKAEKYAEEQLHIATEQQRLAKVQAQLAQKQKRLAEEAAEREGKLRAEAEQQRDLAQKATQEAEAARKQAEAVTDFLVDIFRSPDPERDGRTITVAEMLDKAKTRVETEFKDDRLLQAKLLRAIEQAYSGLGLIEQAAALAKTVYDLVSDGGDPNDPYTLMVMDDLACLYWRLRKLDQSIPLFKELVTRWKIATGEDHFRTLDAMSSLGINYRDAGQLDKALPLLEETVRLCRAGLPPRDPVTLLAMNNLACVYGSLDRFQDALPINEEVLRSYQEIVGPVHPKTLFAMSQVAVAYCKVGRLNDGLPLLKEILRLRQEVQGPDHPDTLESMNNLARGYFEVGQRDQSLAMQEEVLRLQKNKLGPDHPATLNSMNNLALAYRDAGRLGEALPLCEESLRLQRKNLGVDHPDTIRSMSNLALVYQGVGRNDQALRLFEEALALHTAKFGPEHQSTLTVQDNLARVYQDSGRLAEALPMFEEILRLRSEKLGADHPSTLYSMNNLAGAYSDAGRRNEALRLCEDTLRLRRKNLGADHPDTILSMNNLAEAYFFADRLNEALLLLEEAVKLGSAKLGPEHPLTLSVMYLLGVVFSRAGQLDQALTTLKETVQGRKKTLGPDHPDTLATMVLLGNLHVQRGEYAAAEPLLLEAYEAFAKRRAAGPTLFDEQQLHTAATHLVQLYEKSNQPEKATAWKEKLTALTEEPKKDEGNK